MTQRLERFTHSSKKNATHSIIWLHGLGADGHDFVGLLPDLHLRPTTRVIFPHAPVRAITINNGYPMRGWYDILTMDFTKQNEDLSGIAASHAAVKTIYNEEQALGIAPENILFAGFSQGGVIALDLGLRCDCAGILALSTYLSDPENCPHADKSPNGANKPIFQMHGTQDPIVPIASAEKSRNILEKQGFKPRWKTYDMAHQVCLPQIADMAGWLHTLGF